MIESFKLASFDAIDAAMDHVSSLYRSIGPSRLVNRGCLIRVATDHPVCHNVVIESDGSDSSLRFACMVLIGYGEHRNG